MGTHVRCKSYLGGHNPMKDLNDDCNGDRWNLFYREKNFGNGQYYTSSVQEKVADADTGHETNGLKWKMLEHDTIFKNQVFELHRLYRTQRDMMEDIKTKEGHRHEDLIEQSSSSCLQGSQPENGRKSHISRYPLVSSVRSNVSCTDDMNSPVSSTKGNGILSSQFPLQNVCTEAYKVSETRPSKFRKKLIDLQLPADEYIDTKDSEQKYTKAIEFSSLIPSKQCEVRLQSNMKLSADGDCIREKMGSLQEGCNSVSDTRISNGLADLNEPVEVEEETESSSIKIFGHYARNGAVKGTDLPAKPYSGFLDLPSDAMQNPGHGRNYSMNNFLNEKNDNGSKWLPFSCEAELAGGNINLVSRKDKLSLHSTPSKVLGQDCGLGIHFANRIQETPGKEKMAWGLEGFHRREDYPNHSCREPTADSQLCNSYMFLGSAGVSQTRPQITSPWGNRTLQASARNNDILDEKWYVNNWSHSNPGLARDPPSCNGVYHGSSSGSKDLVCSRNDNIASSGLVNHRKEKAYMASSRIDINPLKDLNLNETFPRDAMSEAGSHQDLGILDGKGIREDHKSDKTLLPWLRAKPAFKKNEAPKPDKNVICIGSSPPRASQSSLFGKSEIGKDLKGMLNATSSTNHEIWHKNERYETQYVKKILGVPIFEKLGGSENKASPLASSTSQRENDKEEKKNFLIDINVACDDSLLEFDDETDVGELIIEDKLDRSSSVRNFIDLNSRVTEDEDLPIPSGASSISPMKFVADFDLEEPAAPEEEDNLSEKEKEQSIFPQPQNCESEQLDDEVLMSAAKAIVDILSCQDETQEKSFSPLPDAAELESLLWFADVASTADKLKNILGKECSFDEMDDFEAMTLLLPDTTEEDYMPKPLVPEVLVEEAGGNAPPPRPRRGQPRRGRQRRDFQRDILPGLTTLSRHEMTEDLQTFAGLMRATGHSWNSGSARKYGGTRGRKRKAVHSHDSAPIGGCAQQMNTVETILEDRRSLTGWGKTTRRPRRQRCAPSNAPIVAST
ncbi:hypothetical protein LIER_23215 [Lithospermum erythrorhizon]|uniref:Uncharacterized protein n=1 Tax=Lithospermum erythrorhizon TaxID=34254 RepID=A0AAV3QZ79_LITER